MTHAAPARSAPSRTTHILRASLALNLALLAAVAWLLLPTRRRPVATSARPTPPPTARGSGTHDTRPIQVAARSPNAGITREGIAELEAAGVSRIVLADVVRQDFRRKWNRRVVALENQYAPKTPPQREYLALQRLQGEEELRELKAAFGEAGYAALDREETLRRLNFEDVPLSPAESDQAYRLQKQLEDKQRELQEAMEDGDADVADMGTLQLQAQDAYEDKLRKLLGEDRYNQLKGYTIPAVAGHLEFNELSPSAAQVSTLNTVFSQYQTGEADLAAKLRDAPADPTAIAAELQTLTEAREREVQQTLGADAYNQLEREHDDTYQTLTQFAGAWNLPDADVEPVYASLKQYEGSVDRLRRAAELTELAGQTADWKAIHAAIDASRQQTEATLQALIGPERLRRIVNNGLLSPLGSDRNAPHAPQG